MDSGTSKAPPSAEKPIVISVDCMGGDNGPSAVVAGVFISALANVDVQFLLHGDEALIAPLVAKRPDLTGRITLVHAPRAVSMDDKPSQVMRHGEGTSMWSCVDAIKAGQAAAAVSCGNTGALMAVSMIRLRKIPGVNRPAIACFWPSRNPGGFNVMLDVGADIKAEAGDLMQYAMMGATYARNALGLKRPRIGLLNVGTEDHKGSADLKHAQELLQANETAGDYNYIGFVEGSDIPSNRVDVIVTDGFTGNIALKTGEGTARLVSDFLRETLSSTLWAKLGYLLARRAFSRLRVRMDPRQVNGGVFLGLNGTVVKSHGGADSTGVAAAIGLAIGLARAGFLERLAARVASAKSSAQDAPEGQGASNQQ
jgi:glycerol-3-phosphate acyltransferase PlsX